MIKTIGDMISIAVHITIGYIVLKTWFELIALAWSNL